MGQGTGSILGCCHLRDGLRDSTTRKQLLLQLSLAWGRFLLVLPGEGPLAA